MSIPPSRSSFRFGDGTHKSPAMITIRIQKPSRGPLHIDVNFVRPDVPLLIRLDLLHEKQLIANNNDNQLEIHLHGWKMPITRNNRHLYITWGDKVKLFRRQGLLRFHRKFFHPSCTMLLYLMRGSQLKTVDKETQQLLDDISKACSTCQSFSRNPQGFKVSMVNEGGFLIEKVDYTSC